MPSTTAKYVLFSLLVLTMLGGVFIFTEDVSYTGYAMDNTGYAVEPAADENGLDAVTGFAVQESPVAGSMILLLLVIFLVVSGFLFHKRRDALFFQDLLRTFKEHESYVSVILRVLLGASLIVLSLEFSQTPEGYAFSIVRILAGFLLILGLLTRLVSYLALFYLLGLLLFPGVDILFVVLLIGITLCILILGSGRYGIDHDLWK